MADFTDPARTLDALADTGDRRGVEPRAGG